MHMYVCAICSATLYTRSFNNIWYLRQRCSQEELPSFLWDGFVGLDDVSIVLADAQAVQGPIDRCRVVKSGEDFWDFCFRKQNPGIEMSSKLIRKKGTQNLMYINLIF